MRKMSLKQLQRHLAVNSKDTYSMAVPLAALYKYLYGDFPKGMGLSGAQAEFAQQVLDRLPKASRNLMTLQEQKP